MEVSRQQIEAVNGLPAGKRYDHFIKRIVDQEEVWSLYDGGWAVSSTTSGAQSLPVWPAREYAELCKAPGWSNYKPKSIDLNTFLEEIIPDLAEKKINIAVSMLPSGEAIIVNGKKLVEDIEEEMQNYL